MLGGKKEKMNNRKKIEVIAVIIAVSIIVAMMMPVSAQIGGDITTTDNDEFIKANTTEKINFTITNNRLTPDYITYINITIPQSSDFVFKQDTNGSTIVSNFTQSAENLTWNITDTFGNGTTECFWFNATAPASMVNNTTYTWDTYATYNDSSVHVNKTFNVTVIENTPPAVTINTPTQFSPAYRKGGELFYVNFTYTELNPKNYTVEVGNGTNVINTTTVDYPSGGMDQVASEYFYLNSTAADGKYNVTVTMYDNASNYIVSYQNYSVVKDNTPPTIIGVSASSVTYNSATITWTTNEPSNRTVEYGTTTAYGSTESDATMDTTHSIGLPGLSASTTYHYKVKSTDVAGNTKVSDDHTFTTGSAPSGRRGGRGISRDTDGDGISDIDEMFAGTDWKDPHDYRDKNIVTEKTNLTPTATPTIMPTVPPTATPTADAIPMVTPTPSGFEVVFTIAGLLAVAYHLVLRKRK